MNQRILLAFGDSHTAGAEIDQPMVCCYEKAYPAKIAKHYNFEYENFAVSGGSNDWVLRQYINRIQTASLKNQDVFVLCNFCESSRTFVEVNGKVKHVTPTVFQEKSYNDVHTEYKNFLMYNMKTLDQRSLNQILMIQTLCETFKIPYVFHSSTHWYAGDWSRINKQNYFGLHNTNLTEFDNLSSSKMWSGYCYWGVAVTHPDWNHLAKDPRWSSHYPEEYHEFWANKLIDFINKQHILENIK